MTKGKHRLLSGGVVVALFAGTCAKAEPDAQATAPVPSAPAAAAPASMNEIIVTAQKRTQRLIDVPVAISTISASTLITENMNRLSDYYNRIPGLQYFGPRVSQISIRGITAGNGGGATVAILVDDVPFGSSTSAGQPVLPDFDASLTNQIEVLRGPQGTLYGASGLGGIIKYDLKQPDTSKISGHVEASGSTIAHGTEGWAARGTVNVPVTDWLAVLASGFKRQDAPYLDNIKTGGAATNTRSVWGYRGAVLLRPASNLSITGSALKQHLHAINSDLSLTSGGVPICAACTTTGTAASRRVAVTTFEPVYGDLTLNSLDSGTLSTYEIYSAKAVWSLGKINLTSISAWNRSHNIITSDVTSVFGDVVDIYSPGGSVNIGNEDRTNKFSEELRGNVKLGRFDLLLGGFYTVEHALIDQTLFVVGGSTPTSVIPDFTHSPDRYRETAGFADLTWHITDKFEIQAGGRYAENSHTSENTEIVQARLQDDFGPNTFVASRSKDHAFTWLATPSYKITPDILAFARIATGYRPGGSNISAPDRPTFDPDRVTSYELGLKGRIIPDLLTIETSLFRIDWSSIQLQGTTPITSNTFITNGGKARSQGVETSATLTPWNGMSIDGNFDFDDAVLSETLPSLGGGALVGRKGDRLPGSARFTGSLTGAQRFDLSRLWQAKASANFTYVGDRYGGFDVFGATRPRILIPSYHTINLTAGLTYDTVWQFTLSLRNVTNSRGLTVATNRNGTNVPMALFIQPRLLTATLARNF